MDFEPDEVHKEVAKLHVEDGAVLCSVCGQRLLPTEPVVCVHRAAYFFGDAVIVARNDANDGALVTGPMMHVRQCLEMHALGVVRMLEQRLEVHRPDGWRENLRDQVEAKERALQEQRNRRRDVTDDRVEDDPGVGPGVHPE